MSILLDLLYPPRCMFCHNLTDTSEEAVCPKCAKEILNLSPLHRQLPKNECLSLFAYKDTVAESVKRYKFNSCKNYADTYAALLAAALTRENKTDFDEIIWVPVSRLRKWKRGYDQSEVLAKKLAALLDIPAARALEKCRNNPPQSKTADKAERKRNVAGVFVCAAQYSAAGKKILLIDDVITTGATLEECTRLLRKSGAKSVYCATIASA